MADMANLLFLVHRLPFPPDKGDKVRSFHLLSHLAAQHRTFVGAFYDDPQRPSPFDATELPIVFTGAMDYWPNMDAVIWFVREMLPELKVAWPNLRFHIVGRGPTPAVQALAGPAVHVTGTVPDVRPYLQHAAVVVAPMRVARGIQNKIVEAMAMARPVVAAAPCVASLDAVPGIDLLPAVTPRDFVQQISALLRDPERARQIGLAARQRIQCDYRWSDRLAPVGRHIDAAVLARTQR